MKLIGSSTRTRKHLPEGVYPRPPRRTGPGTVCMVQSCSRQVFCKGMCRMHLERKNTGKDLHAPIRRPKGSVGLRDEDGNRFCYICKEWKSPESFGKRSSQPDGLDPGCKKCRNARARKMRHGLDPQDIAGMIEEQGGCAICQTEEPGRNGWQVDHDHACCAVGPSGGKTCGKCLRGILCSGCNTMLGMSKDNPSTLRRGASYLERVK